MGFLIHTTGQASMPGLLEMPASAITPKVGQALVMKNGNLAICGATEKPTYICMTERKTPVKEGEMIPVIRTNDEIIFATTNQADFAAVKLGEKVTLHTDGMQVTATKASGVAEVVYIGGNAVGSEIHVRF